MDETVLAEVPPVEVPLALARLHWRTQPGAALRLGVRATGERSWSGDALVDVMVGAGFRVQAMEVQDLLLVATVERQRSLPDTVGPGMRLLVCGLNPSEYAADRGVGYARPGNRFWPAALDAGLVTRSHDPLHALAAHGVGMTDLVKRATPRASMLEPAEYRDGLARVRRMVQWLQPAAVCFVGLQGWRAAVDPGAAAGTQPGHLAGRPAYVMPSTSGLNAHSSREDLVEHLRAAAALAG